MAKDAASSRIPRLDGVTRIPVPGSLRPPSATINYTKLGGEIFKPPVLNNARPSSYAGLRPPILDRTNAIKKSSSGERLNNAMSAVSKKTSTAFKKLFNKAEKSPGATKMTQIRKPMLLAEKNFVNMQSLPMVSLNKNETIAMETNTDNSANRTQLLTRSNTFVRDEPQQNITMLVHSTPAARLTADTTQCYQTPALNDATMIINRCDTMTIKKGVNAAHMKRKLVEEETLYDVNATRIIDKFQNCASILSSTMNYKSPDNTQNLQTPRAIGQTLTLSSANLSQTFNVAEQTQVLEADVKGNVELLSPITNATYSNPGSIDNLINLEDVSMPSGLDLDATLQAHSNSILDEPVPVLAPDKTQMKLQLNSTMNTERLLDITENMQLINHTKDFMYSPRSSLNAKNSSKLLYMSLCSATTTPDRHQKLGKCNVATGMRSSYQHTPLPANLLSPMLLKGAQSDLVLPTRTPDDEHLQAEPMDVDAAVSNLAARTEEFFAAQAQQKAGNAQTMSLQDINNAHEKQKSRFSFGLDLTESTLDCSIELIDVSLSSIALSQVNCALNSSSVRHNNSNNTADTSVLQPTSLQQQQQQHLQQQSLKKQNSFEMDESLGILTPDQMKEFLDSAATNNTNNLDLQLNNNNNSSNNQNRLSFHQMRMEQTPSPEELPLDPVEVKTDISDFLSQQQQTLNTLQQRHLVPQATHQDSLSQQTETELSKADPMIKSNVSKISTSFITSVTSVTSLDTGYQGDGEMSRPASRGACDHSPSNGPIARKAGPVSRQPSFNQLQQMPPPIRRQDQMTDSDFFTESDADDLQHRGGDRRAQVIDGQLYGPTLVKSSAASVFITEDPQMEDSCMESSGIFTDVENRCEEDLAVMRRSQQQATQELSPDADGDDSTETVRSNRAQHLRALCVALYEQQSETNALGQGQTNEKQTYSQSSSMLQSFSNERLSADTTLSNRTSYCSMDGANSAVHISNSNCKSYNSLEETAFTSTQNEAKRDQITGMKTLCGERTKLRSNNTVDNLSSPRKHASLTSLSVAESAQSAYVIKSAIKSASGSAIFAQSGFSNNITGTAACSSKVSLVSECVKSTTATTTTPRTTPKLVKSVKKLPHTPKTASPRQKSHVPNKWEAVMNKIANNKATQVRKNYNDVKSKVTTRNVLVNAVVGNGENSTPTSSTASPRIRRSPTATNANVLKVLQTNTPKFNAVNVNLPSKRALLEGANKRGRSYSKDSQKSSQSDLSLTSGSPKLLAKTPLRAAKKRDVRNLSISPTDLGPPPKTQQTINGAATRTKAAVTVSLTQKRISSLSTSPPTSTASPIQSAATPTQSTNAIETPTATNGSVVSNKNFTPAKKQSITLRRLDTKTINAKPTPKDHNNRLLGSAQSINTTAPTTIKNGSKVASVNELHEHNINNNNNHSNSNHNHDEKLQIRTNSQSSSPVLSDKQQQLAKKLTTTTTTQQTGGTTPSLEKKSQIKLPTTRKFFLHKQQQQQQQHGSGGTPTESSAKIFKTTTPTAATAATTTVSTPTSSEYLDAVELQSLKLLNRHSCNGRLDYESLERHLQQVEAHKQRQDKGVAALGILINYLVCDLDAFACPAIKRKHEEVQVELNKILNQLDDARSECADLLHQLCDKEVYYTQREEELQALHRCELDKAHETARDLELMAKKRIHELEQQLANKDEQQKRLMDDYRYEMELKLNEKQLKLSHAEQHMQLALKNEKELAARLDVLEYQQSLEREAALKREHELNERINELTKQLEQLRENKQHRERELRDKLNLSQDEIALLRSSPRNHGDSTLAMRHSSASCSSTPLSEMSRLQNEAESLRCVLELKQKEISKLNKQNEELLRDAEERSALRGKISSLESHKEMLQSELNIKIEKEKECLRQIEEMQKKLKYENQKHTRLSYDNEALAWQLKQRSEQLHIIQTKFQESMKDQSSSLDLLNRSSLGNVSLSHHNTTASISEQGSPPTSPVIKGVIEKNDSVSWVLEMDDDTPEAAASKIVRRVGSFRSVERSPSLRRHLSVSGSSSACSSQHSSSNVSIAANRNAGPNPLSQSMSATSVIREHSNDTMPTHVSARVRSQSVSSSKCMESVENKPKSNKKMLRQHSMGTARKLEPVTTWKEPISASSPYGNMRPRSSTLKSGEQAPEDLYIRTAAGTTNAHRKLITCDTSSLNSGERLELRTLPKSRAQVLKSRKKCLEIQESAGEAMVSGTNSEDEACSASSDEIASSVSTGSATSSSSTSLNHMKHTNMSLEDVLLLEKINSLNGTPMECSWSDDVDIYGDTTA